MYKPLNTGLLLFLLFLITTALFSCDGRNRAYKNNAEILKEHHLLKDFSKKTEHTPKSYTEIITDTLLQNNFRVKLKYYSLVQDSVITQSVSKNNINVTHHYNNFKALLQVSNNENIIISTVIDKSVFKTFDTEAFWSRAIMQSPWIDYQSISKNGFHINVSFCIPESTQCKDFSLIINYTGDIEIKEINLSKINI